MKAPKADGPNEPSGQHRRKPDGSRPKKQGGGERGPIGFGSVMRDVRGDGSNGGGTGTSATTMPGVAGFDPALAQAQQLDAGVQAARKMGAVQTVGDELADATTRPRSAVDALAAQDRSLAAQLQAGQPLVPSALGRMTPSTLLATVLDESRRLEIAEAMKELHVELEPEDLGPVVVRLRKGPDGTLDIGFRAREGEAARVLEQGTESLRDRLAGAGFAAVRIAVEHDAELALSSR
jgi:flagellar hook-length control protein FliK